MKNTITKIPFVDLHSQYLKIKKDIDSAIFNVIDSSSFIRGPYVNKFEEEFSKKIGMDNCISCANGTDAIYIALKALNVKPGDEVIVPAHSWISTSETVTQAGAEVIFCDTNNYDFTIDASQIKSKITSKTVGIIPVHLYGQPADMESIMSIANDNNLWVIEDCAQAHLAKYKGKNIGTFGDVSTFSFYPGKNL
jgi:dTDP-4-amino-4,6-dideoxygalactose transaminase